MASANTLFISKGKDTRIVIEASKPHFRPDGQIHYLPGKTVEFKNGLYEVTDREARRFDLTKDELAERIRNSPLNGAFIFEKGKEPGAPAVPMEEILAKVSAAAAKQNVKTLQALLEQEEDNDARGPVLEAIRVALGTLGDTERGKRLGGRPIAPVAAASGPGSE